MHSVPPDVQVTASRQRVELGGFTTLFCNVTRSNPEINGRYVWINEGTGVILPEISNILSLNILSLSDYGNYTCMVTNTAGAAGSGSVIIQQGCKFEIILVKLSVIR